MKMIMAILHKDDELGDDRGTEYCRIHGNKAGYNRWISEKKSTTIMVVVDDEKVSRGTEDHQEEFWRKKDDHLCKPGIDLRTE